MSKKFSERLKSVNNETDSQNIQEESKKEIFQAPKITVKKKVYQPDDLIPMSQSDLDRLKNSNNVIKILLSLDYDLDDAIILEQNKLRRETGKKPSKEDLILSILKEHFLTSKK